MDMALPSPTSSGRRDQLPQSQEAIETMYLDPNLFQSARMRRSRGRLSLNPRVFQTIITQVSEGIAPVVACQAAGIAASTYHSWMRKGEAFTDPTAPDGVGEEPNDPTNRLYRQFFLAIQQAEAQSEIRIAQRFERATENNWQAASSFLSKRFPERWGDSAATRSLAQLQSQSQSPTSSLATQQAAVICNVQFVKEILKDNKLSNMAETLLIEASKQLDSFSTPTSSKDIIDASFTKLDTPE